MKLKLVIFLSLIFGFIFLFDNKIIFAQTRTVAPVDDPDINIRKRGWQIDNSVSPNALIDHPQNPDNLQPDLLYTFHSPNFTAFYQVNAYNGSGLDQSNTNSPGLATVQMNPGDDIKAPVVGRGIGGGFAYTVLYISADGKDIVLHNGLEDSIVTSGGHGYSLHFLNIQVNPDLKKMYDDNEAAGRKQLVAIPCNYEIGITPSGSVDVAIRDSGNFMDIRFKDWWNDTSPGTCSDQGAGYVTAGSSNQPATNTEPYDLSTEVPCNETNYDVYKSTNPTNAAVEFHSLRPYPASPCLKTVQDQAYLCSNDLVAIKATSPGANGTCTAPAADGSYSCTYTNVEEHVPVSVDLTNAQLPILGNTEDVPNATWTSPNTNAPNLTAAQRVNGYVSWYLNGVVNKAENDFSGDDPNNLVNYSGPLNKLLPWAGQAMARIATITRASTSQGQGPDAPDKNGRHNQIVECDFPEQSGSMPCYLYTLERFISFLKVVDPNNTMTQGQGDSIANASTTVRRLVDWVGHTPPFETDYKTVGDWLQAYSQWLGNICITPIFGCPTTAPNPLARFFDFIPFSTTEDRVGTVGTNQVAGGAGASTLINSDLTSAYLQGLVAEAANWAHVPPNVLVALVHGEACQGAGPLCTASDTDVESWSGDGGYLPYNCVGTAYGGPLGFDSNTWFYAQKGIAATLGRTPNVCNVKDAVYAAAFVVAGSINGCFTSGFDINQAASIGAWDQAHVTNAVKAWTCGCGSPTPACTKDENFYLSSPYIGISNVQTGPASAESQGVTFTPTAGTNYQHNLYFAHTQETVELATQLQDTFKSSDKTAPSSHDTNTPPDIGPGCTIADTRGDPTGDNLYGNINRGSDQQIAGTVNFFATYTCHFTPIAVSGVTGATFGNNGGISGAYTYTCDSATAHLSMFTQSPEVQNAWDVLVGGTQSIFKRFFPQTGSDSPVSEIKETPANTNITYQATAGDEVASGNGGNAGTTSTASLYVPYVGGIKDYFLDAIQTALRPQGMGTSNALASGSVTFPGGKVPAGLCSPSNLSSFGSNASTMSCICQHESGGNPFIVNPVGVDYSVGLFQINLLYNPSVVPDGLRQMFIHDNVPNANSISCYQAFNSKNGSDIRSGYQQVVQDCVNWYSDPVNNIAEAHNILNSIGLKGGWYADSNALLGAGKGCF